MCKISFPGCGDNDCDESRSSLFFHELKTRLVPYFLISFVHFLSIFGCYCPCFLISPTGHLLLRKTSTRKTSDRCLDTRNRDKGSSGFINTYAQCIRKSEFWKFNSKFHFHFFIQFQFIRSELNCFSIPNSDSKKYPSKVRTPK